MTELFYLIGTVGKVELISTFTTAVCESWNVSDKYTWDNAGDLKLQLHDAIYRLRFYSNSLNHISSLSNSHSNVASVQKNRDDKSHRVIVALNNYPWTRLSERIMGAIKRQFLHMVTHVFDNSNLSQEIFAINVWGDVICSLGHGRKDMLTILPTIWRPGLKSVYYPLLKVVSFKHATQIPACEVLPPGCFP